MGSSSHIPRLLTYNTPPPADVLHVIFLQRLSEEERTQILHALDKGQDAAWAAQFEPNAQRRPLLPMPWIRDWWPSSDVILEICAIKTGRDAHGYRSFVLVDSGWDAGTVIAAHWTVDSDGVPPHLLAARVPSNIANLLLTLLDRRSVGSFAEALGEEAYEDAKVDFYRDLPAPVSEVVAAPYDAPAFLPQNVGFSTSKLVLLALKELPDSAVLALKSAIAAGEWCDEEMPRPDMEIINWQGDPLPRSELPNLFKWMKSNTAQDVRQGYAFFVDNVLDAGADRQPQILAAHQKEPRNGDVFADELCLIPVDTDQALEWWRAAVTCESTAEPATLVVDRDTTMECGDIWRKELAIDMAKPIDFDKVECCPVFFLRPFTLQEERQIRANLSKQCDSEEDQDWGNEYFYAGYLWLSNTNTNTNTNPNPNTDTNTETRSTEDLRDLFEKCDPKSPLFNPSYSSLRMPSYPANFIAVDDRALDSAKPRVILASSLDFYHPTNDLGWIYGLVDAEEAHVNWVNLDIANMGVEEMVEEPQKLWLSDLKASAREDWDEEE
ncbi:hypothetical protein LTR85_009075 [Meristemomyces frigidus]|nr:hypothetical protein LTR85_009075 [Meristemomyces frigidus]